MKAGFVGRREQGLRSNTKRGSGRDTLGKFFQIFNENDKNKIFTSLRGQLLGFREN